MTEKLGTDELFGQNVVYECPPPREFSWKRDFRFPIHYFFWHHTWWIRRIWCKHNGVLFSDSTKGEYTMCANCYSKDVPQMAGQCRQQSLKIVILNEHDTF